VACYVDFGATKCKIKFIKDSIFFYETIDSNREIITQFFQSLVFSGNQEIYIALGGMVENDKIVFWPNRTDLVGLELSSLFDPDVLGREFYCLDDGFACLFADCTTPICLDENSMVITFGTGIGSGVIINGQYFGNEGICEIGHVTSTSSSICKCGKIGCLQAIYIDADRDLFNSIFFDALHAAILPILEYLSVSVLKISMDHFGELEKKRFRDMLTSRLSQVEVRVLDNQAVLLGLKNFNEVIDGFNRY
jgi:hypothetical protein